MAISGVTSLTCKRSWRDVF